MVLQNLNFQLRPGEAWLLTGPNGGGKSSFLGLLRGDLSPTSGRRSYVLEGQERASAVRARRLFPLVSPSLEAWFLTRDWVQTVRDVLLAGAEGEMLHLSAPEAGALARLAEVVALTHLNGLLERDFRTLSHGQRRRVLLARALMPRPAALLLDEFTDGLSVAARSELKTVLEGVAAGGVALVLATHRPDEAPALAWRHLRAESGTVLEVKVQASTGQESAAQESTAQSVQSQRDHAAPSHLQRPITDVPSLQPLVTLSHVSVYRNGHHALGPLDWEWRAGQHWLVTGENGAGKSTLARLIAGEFHPALGGRVTRHFLTRDVLTARRRAVGVVGAELTIRQRRDWTGQQLIASAFGGSEGFAASLTAEQAGQVVAVAGRLGVGDLLARPADTLSQGQLGRLLLARAVVHRPKLLILDEAMNFLDDAARAAVFALLPDLIATGTHLLVVAHRVADAPLGLTHHLHLRAGRTAASGAMTQASEGSQRS